MVELIIGFIIYFLGVFFLIGVMSKPGLGNSDLGILAVSMCWPIWLPTILVIAYSIIKLIIGIVTIVIRLAGALIDSLKG